MSNKKSKICPECGARLEHTQFTHKKDGVVYSEKGFECVECGYIEKIRNRKDKILDE